nr:hypothetical protein BaRGS_016349 [Batillaria attramentaria]
MKDTRRSWDLDLFNNTFFYLVGVSGTVVSIIGIVGNSLSISVLSHVDMRSSPTSTYLLVLAVYDNLFLVARLLAVSGEWLVYGITRSRVFQLKYTTPAAAVLEPIAFVLGTGSIFTTVGLTIDRCIAVMLPLKASVICTKRRVRIVQSVVFLLSVLTNVPLFLETRLEKSFNKEHNVTFLDRVETPYRDTEFHATVYLLFLYPIVKTFAPAVIIFLCNSIIAGTVLRARKTGMTSSDVTTRVNDAHRLTAQVVFISLITLLSRLFEALTFVMLEINDTVFYDECPVYCFVVAAMNEFLATFNSAANFFCYCYFGQRFRAILLQQMGVCKASSCCIPDADSSNRRRSGMGSKTVSLTSVTSTASQAAIYMVEVAS